MSEPRYTSFSEFWPYYLNEHSKPATRWMHFVGTTIGVGIMVWSLATLQPWFLLLGLLPGYGFAWVSHFFIEKNRPATFTYPTWSFIGDFKMWGLMLTGRIGPEVEAHVTSRAATGEAA